jgi:hypothetical protein
LFLTPPGANPVSGRPLPASISLAPQRPTAAHTAALVEHIATEVDAAYWAVTTRRKSKKNTDLWEENGHSGPVEKAGATLIPPPHGASTPQSNTKTTCVIAIHPDGHRRVGFAGEEL